MSKIIDTRYQKIRRNKEELIEHLNTFKLDIKPSVGIWYFTPVGGRFHESYVPFKDIPEKIEMAAEMAKYGVKAIEISIRAMTIMYNNKILELKDKITDFIESEREDVTEIYKLIFKI